MSIYDWGVFSDFQQHPCTKNYWKNNTICDILTLEDKYSYEKIHNRFCYSLLGLRKTACHISAKSEIGRYPLTNFIKTQILKYSYLRILIF